MTQNEVAQYVAEQAPKYGLDATAVMAIADQEGFKSGSGPSGIGDGGHAFGPWQLNDAGGVLTNHPVTAQGKNASQAWAWSQPGIDFALQGMQSVASGLAGARAVTAIATNFERPRADLLPGEISNGIAALGKWATTFAQGIPIPGVTTTPPVQGPADTHLGTNPETPVVAVSTQAGTLVAGVQTLVAGLFGSGFKATGIKPDMSGLILLLASLFAILVGALVWRGDAVKAAPGAAAKWVVR